MTHSETLALLRDARDLLNASSYVRFLDSRRAARFALVSRIDAHLGALSAAAGTNPAVALARARCSVIADVEIDMDERETRAAADGIWVRAWLRVSHDNLAISDNAASRADPERYRSIVGALPTPTRTIFLLHCVDGLDYCAIAARCEVSVDAVERHIAEALIEIDRRLDGETP